MAFENKLVAIVNKDIEIGVALNAIAHASLALGGKLGEERLLLGNYIDASSNVWPMSDMPYIILRGKSGEIRKAVMAAKEENITQIAFVETMTGGGYKEQQERTAQVTEENHIYYAAILFGPWDSVSQITRKFSLFK